jgi:hypothetical protein
LLKQYYNINYVDYLRNVNYNVKARRSQINITFCKSFTVIAGGIKSPINFGGGKSQLSDSSTEVGANCFK